MTAEDPDALYTAYKANPSPDTLHSVVKSLAPTINYALAGVGADSDPVVRSKAMVYAANAVEKYDPDHTAGANLATHVSSQLRQLSRTARQSRSPVRIPERVQLESYKMMQSRKDFADQFGRDPSVIELADFTGTPVKRIEKLNKFQVSMPSETGQMESSGELEQSGPDFDRDATDYVYHDADHTDRRILEMRIGYGGHPVYEPAAIAAHLNLSPSQLSRRSMRLAGKIQELRSALDKV